MKPEAVECALELGKKWGQVFVATADADGSPHVAAGRMSAAREGLGILDS